MERPAAEDELRFIEDFALMLVEGGMPRMPARAFAAVLAEDSGRLTAQELAARLQVSPAAISGAVRYLVQSRLLHRGRDPGSRSDHYRLSEDDHWYESMMERGRVLERFEQSAARGAELLGEGRPAGRRLRETQEFFAFLREELPKMMDRWHERRG